MSLVQLDNLVSSGTFNPLINKCNIGTYLKPIELDPLLDKVIAHVKHTKVLERTDALHLVDGVIANPQLLQAVRHGFLQFLNATKYRQAR